MNDRDDPGIGVALITVRRLNSFSALFDLLLIEEGLAADRGLLPQLVLVEILVPIKDNFGDEGLLAHHEDDCQATGRWFRLDLHVFKEPHRIDQTDLCADCFGRIGITDVQCEPTPDRRFLNPFVPSHLNRRDFLRTVLGIQRAGGSDNKRADHDCETQ